MAKIISFAWTTPALLAGRKTCTRREWAEDYAHRFREGDPITAYSRQPRFGGIPVARLELTEDVKWCDNADAPDSDYEAEGFAFFEQNPEYMPKTWPLNLTGLDSKAWEAWKRNGQGFWVVRFKVLELLEEL